VGLVRFAKSHGVEVLSGSNGVEFFAFFDT